MGSYLVCGMIIAHGRTKSEEIVRDMFADDGCDPHVIVPSTTVIKT